MLTEVNALAVNGIISPVLQIPLQEEIKTIHGHIYCITNTINNKVYIGQTTVGIIKRMKAHKKSMQFCLKHKKRKTPLISAFIKYGFENFTIIEIDRAYSAKELNDLEKCYIQIYNSEVIYNEGYNVLPGTSNDYFEISKKIFSKIYHERYQNWEKWKMNKNQRSNSNIISEKTQFKEGHATPGEWINDSRQKLKLFYKYNKPVNAIEIKRIEDGKIFYSLGEAADVYKVSKASFRKYLLGHSSKLISGTFEIIKGELKCTNQSKEKKPIICVETGKIYESITEAAREIGVCRSVLKNVVRGKNKTCKGLHYRLVSV